MRLLWIFLLIAPILNGVETEEESLFLRRIADFWQEGEYQIAKSQMEEFIIQYPESPFSDALCAALGDLFLREKNYSTALNYYSQVESEEFFNQVFLNRMQCLHEMGWYATLADECEEFLKKEPNLNVTYFLAIGLYHQCINASQETDQLQELAQRARPCFETLYKSELKNEVAQGYAHLLCVVKDFQKATEIYLELAKNDPSIEEEMLFQVALLQSEYDKSLALQTFDQIVSLGETKAKEAAYNRMVLAFDLGRYEELTKENILEQIPEDRIGTARLFIGRSLLNQKMYDQALIELNAYIENAPVSETLYAAVLSLLDASFQCSDLDSLDRAIAKLQANYPSDRELPKAYFSKAQLLKKKNEIKLAKNQLVTLLDEFPNFELKSQVTFELIHLSHKDKDWDSCYQLSREYLLENTEQELAPFVWRYYVSASAEIGMQNPEHKFDLIQDLQSFLTLSLTDMEKEEWELMLAKTYYETEQYDDAIHCLNQQKTPNAKLLLSLCYRDRDADQEKFCTFAEEALRDGANLIQKEQVHASLYNAYLSLNNEEKCAEHLLEAFVHKAEIKLENLIWLADYVFEKLQHDENNLVLAARASALLDHSIQEIKKQDLVKNLEPITCKLAKVYSILGRFEDAIVLLESLKNPQEETKLLIAEACVKKGMIEKATKLFDEIICTTSTIRSPIYASAALQAAQLKLSNKKLDSTEIAKQLKNLVIQKNFSGEPNHLEAALEYISLQGQNDPKKQLMLFKKTKQDFEKTDDLLSKDYHAARKLSPKKDRIYQSYITFMEANILSLESKLTPENKALQAKSKDLLLRIVDEPDANHELKERAKKLLANEK